MSKGQTRQSGRNKAAGLRRLRLLDGREYAVRRDDSWHIATWDGSCFAVTSNWQSGDRGPPGQVQAFVLLPAQRR